jgi:penicillin amidase
MTSAELPSRLDPAEGYLACANARPDAQGAVVGFHFSPPNRMQRLKHLLAGKMALSIADLMRIQSDVKHSEAAAQRDTLLSWLGDARLNGPRAQTLCEILRSWDGNYGARSSGALAFELLFFHLAREMVPKSSQAAYEAAWGTRALIWADILAASEATRTPALARALRSAAKDFRPGEDWGHYHRLRLAHPLGIIPIVGRRYRILTLPAPGTSETLMKTAHGLTNRRHYARYGSVARHISDLSDPNANHFILLGGQDGWFASTSLADQAPLWQRGDYVSLPLDPATARKNFPHAMTLRP